MPNIFKSSTRIVLLMFSATLCAGFLLGRVSAEQFLSAAMVVLTAFFTLKGNAPAGAPDPLAGK